MRNLTSFSHFFLPLYLFAPAYAHFLPLPLPSGNSFRHKYIFVCLISFYLLSKLLNHWGKLCCIAGGHTQQDYEVHEWLTFSSEGWMCCFDSTEQLRWYCASFCSILELPVFLTGGWIELVMLLRVFRGERLGHLGLLWAEKSLYSQTHTVKLTLVSICGMWEEVAFCFTSLWTGARIQSRTAGLFVVEDCTGWGLRGQGATWLRSQCRAGRHASGPLLSIGQMAALCLLFDFLSVPVCSMFLGKNA